jgi:polyvinyl alcohol dehydrogenase (cytochrome)
MSTSQTRRISRALPVAATLLCASAVFAAPGGGAGWTTAGYDAQNTRNNRTEAQIGVGNVSTLQPKWRVATEGDVSATPAVDGSSVYAPDFAGNLYALNRATGAVRWQVPIKGVPYGAAITSGLMLVGTDVGNLYAIGGSGS